MIGDAQILVVEDNATTARNLRVFLEAEGYRVRHAASGREALEQFGRAPGDLVLLDLNLPDLDGLEVCRSLRSRSAVPVVMLTARTAEENIVEGLESGADDYVCKPFGSRELLARVRRCLERARRPPATGPRLRLGDLELDRASRRVRMRGEEVRLTRSEFDILELLARNPGRVFTRSQIIDAALGHDFDGFDRTIDTHVWSLRRKLGEPRGCPRYILSEVGIGYRMRSDDAGS